MKTKIKKVLSWIGDNYYPLLMNILLFCVVALVFQDQLLLSVEFALLTVLVTIIFRLEKIIKQLGTLLWMLFHKKE